jgi:hypothetical protein
VDLTIITSTPTPLPTNTPTPLPTATNTPLPTSTPEPTPTPDPTSTPTPTPNPTSTPTPTPNPTVTPTPTPDPTATPTPTPNPTSTPTPTPNPTSTPTPTPNPTSTPTPTPVPTGQCYTYYLDENFNISTSQYGIRYTYPGSFSTDNALNTLNSGLKEVNGITFYTYSVCSQVEPTWLEMITPTSGSGGVVPNGVYRTGPNGTCTGNAECDIIAPGITPIPTVTPTPTSTSTPTPTPTVTYICREYRIENNTEISISISYYDCSGNYNSDSNLGSGNQLTFCANQSYGLIDAGGGSLFTLFPCLEPTSTPLPTNPPSETYFCKENELSPCIEQASPCSGDQIVCNEFEQPFQP